MVWLLFSNNQTSGSLRIILDLKAILRSLYLVFVEFICSNPFVVKKVPHLAEAAFSAEEARQAAAAEVFLEVARV